MNITTPYEVKRVQYSSTVTGFASTTRNTIDYTLEGKRCICSIDISGTSNATTFTFTLPFNVNASVQTGLYTLHIKGINNSAAMSLQPWLRTRAGTSNVVDVYASYDNGTLWTAANTKAIQATLIYYIA